MTKQKFAIIHNLEGLGSEELTQYLRDASVYFKLDPDLNGLDTIWMSTEDGMRKLVAYARKGTTDILREIHGISIINLVRDDGFPGCAAFMATGKNPNGRQEIATGAHAIEGLKNERLAYAIMTAQTRALRRLTLQFVGGGLLDVSEVNAQLADIGSSPASLAQLAGTPTVMPPPQVAPSTAPGRDITTASVCRCGPNECCVRCQHVGGNGADRTPTDAEFAAAGIPKHGPIPAVTMFAPSQDPKTQAQITKVLLINQVENLAKVYAEGAAALAAKPTPEPHSVAQNPPNQGVTLQEIPANEAATEPKKRTRRKRGQVDIASPGQCLALPPQALVIEATLKAAEIGGSWPTATDLIVKSPNADIAESQRALTLSHPVLTLAPPSVAPVSPEKPVSAPVETAIKTETVVLSAEKQKEYRDRLSKYAQDILPRAGMMPSDGIGGVTMKLRRFATVFCSITNVQALTEEQWQDLLGFLDSYSTKQGAQALVQYIDKAIGVTK